MCVHYAHDRAALELNAYREYFKTAGAVACFTVYFLQQLN